MPEADGDYAILEPGEEIELEFPATGTPELAKGWRRDFILKSTGYYESTTNLSPREYTLLQNYPNPFNAGTNISFVLNKPGMVNVSVYNILGQSVAVLMNEELESGEHSVSWDGLDSYGNTLSTGMYLYQLQFGGTAQTKKMTLLK